MGKRQSQKQQGLEEKEEQRPQNRQGSEEKKEQQPQKQQGPEEKKEQRPQMQQRAGKKKENLPMQRKAEEAGECQPQVWQETEKDNQAWQEAKREKERQVIYWLNQIPFLGPATVGKMRNHVRDFLTLYNIEGTEWVSLGILKEGEGAYVDQAKKDFRKSVDEYHSLESRGIKFITILDRGYPQRLLSLPDAPLCLLVKGGLPKDDQPSAAIIGSRKATRYGLEVAKCFGRELALGGVQVISGLASGIDGAGHMGALEGGGFTYGILGCGINICYPKENWNLYRQVAERGGMVSEYRLGEPPQAKNFPIRNRIISGLSDVVLVVEAREKSGSLITVGIALEQGKDIFAVPGRITDPGSQGCNHLIRSGALLAGSPGDILEYFGVKFEKKLCLYEKSEKGLAKKEKMVYSCLDLQAKHLEDIVSQSGLSLSDCMMILLDLELKGYAERMGGNYYGRKLS